MPVAHPDLAAGLDLGTYTSKLYTGSSVQSCQAAGDPEARLGEITLADCLLSAAALASYGGMVDMLQVGCQDWLVVLEQHPVRVYSARKQVQD